MDAEQIIRATPMINHLSTIAAIGCVFPTYFLHLRPATYRLILSEGIIFGLSTLAIGITALLVGPFDDFVRDTAIGTLVSFSPLVVVLTAILVGIKWISRVVLWNTIVLTSLILDWAGVWAYFWALS
ncbi:putative membrane protein [Bradyrhizobium embrapense]